MSERVCAQSRPALCGPVDCSPPNASLLGILGQELLEWAAMLSSSVFPTWDRTRVSCIGGWVLYPGTTWDDSKEDCMNGPKEIF